MLENLLLLAEGGGLLELLSLQVHVLLAPDPLQFLLDFLDLGRRRERHQAGTGRGLVDDIDGLVGQLPIGDVAVGEIHGRPDRNVGDLHPMVRLVLVAEAPNDLDGFGHAGRLDDHGLEPPLERAVLLDVLAVLVEGGGADGLDLAARERGLQHVGGVNGAFGRAGPNERVQLIEEQDDVLRLPDLLHDRLQPLLELATVLRAGHEGAEVELEQPLVQEDVGNVVADDLLGQTFHDGRLAHSGLADEDGIVLRPSGQDLDDALDLLLPPDDGVELGLTGELGEVTRELVENRRLGALLRAWVVLVAEKGQGLLPHLVQSGAERLEDLGGDRLAFLHEAEEQMLRPDVVVTELARFFDRKLEDALGLGRERHLTERERLGEASQRSFDLRLYRLQAKPEALQYGRRDPFSVADEAEQNMLRPYEVVTKTSRFLARQYDDPPRSLREPFKHWCPPTPFGERQAPIFLSSADS